MPHYSCMVPHTARLRGHVPNDLDVPVIGLVEPRFDCRPEPRGALTAREKIFMNLNFEK